MTARRETDNAMAVATRWFHALPTDPYDVADIIAAARSGGALAHPLENPLSIWCYRETGVWPMIGDTHFAVEVDGVLVEAPTPFHVKVFLIMFDCGRFPSLVHRVTNGGHDS